MHTWGKNEGPSGIRLSFILGVAGFVLPIAVVMLALRAPDQISPKVASPASAQSFQTKVSQLEQMQTQTSVAQEVHLTAEEISSAFAEGNASLSESAPVVGFHNDVVTGQFTAKIAGQQLYVTVSGHLGAKDGYVTFEPTSFKVGDLTVPVALVNAALQKKIQEQREQMKLPAFVGDLRVENGELIIRPK
ncbi:MAG TPA: hypothetical protein VMT53_18965 [Terriglobales bacterium]|nr:hypothetical protein [Terriglobales bacterium]